METVPSGSCEAEKAPAPSVSATATIPRAESMIVTEASGKALPEAALTIPPTDDPVSDAWATKHDAAATPNSSGPFAKRQVRSIQLTRQGPSRGYMPNTIPLFIVLFKPESKGNGRADQSTHTGIARGPRRPRLLTATHRFGGVSWAEVRIVDWSAADHPLEYRITLRASYVAELLGPPLPCSTANPFQGS